MLKQLLIPAFLLLSLSCFAQQSFFTKADDAYFQQQRPRYQKWLEAQGFDELLTIYEINTDSNQVNLILETVPTDADTARAAWERLKSDVQTELHQSLEVYLFNHFCHLMEVTEDSAVIEIYNTISDQQPCFIKAIYFKERFRVEDIFCKNKVDSVLIDHFDLSRFSTQQSAAIKALPKAKRAPYQLKTAIQQFFQNHYENADINWRHERDQLLKCQVKELRREVLTDEANPLLAEVLQWFGYEVDWVKRELLTITVDYQLHEEGIQLMVEINGKYGSGFHRPRRNAYIDMEPEFEEYLSHYTEIITQEIKNHLIQD